jgi:hypothetical protein
MLSHCQPDVQNSSCTTTRRPRCRHVGVTHRWRHRGGDVRRIERHGVEHASFETVDRSAATNSASILSAQRTAEADNAAG